jgi:uncharacterized membrane protein YwzB
VSAPGSTGWQPLLSPLPAHGYEWLLLIPIVVFLCIAYKAIRCEHMDRFWKNTFQMVAVVIAGLIMLAAAGWVVVELLAMLPASG